MIFWCRHGGSNTGPTRYECVALPTELCRRGGAQYRKTERRRQEKRSAGERVAQKHDTVALTGRTRPQYYDTWEWNVLADVRQHHPEYLQACDDWNDGFPIGTWEAYARSVPPEVEI